MTKLITLNYNVNTCKTDNRECNILLLCEQVNKLVDDNIQLHLVWISKARKHIFCLILNLSQFAD